MTSATITQTHTVADASPGWSVPLSFDDFDPSLGTATDVHVTVAGTITGDVSIENLGATAATFQVSFPGSINVVGGSTKTLLTSVALDPVQAIALGADDGTTDFAGGSGTIVSGISSTASASSVYNPGSSGIPFVGTGTLDLTASSEATSSVVGNGNVFAVTHAEAGASVSLQYDYQTAASGSGGGDDGSVSTLAPPTLAQGFNDISNEQTTAVQTLIISDRTTGWNTEVGAARFNPALGALEAVNLRLITDINGGFAAENLSSARSTVSMTDSATVRITLPGTFGVTSGSPSISNDTVLGIFDGTVDFAGGSGFSQGNLTNTQTATAQIGTDDGDLAAFIGVGTIALAVSALTSSLVTGPADLESELHSVAGAVVEISYVYIPSTTPVTPSAQPSITGAIAGQAITDQGTIAPFANLAITDPNDGQTETVTLTLSDAGNGTLTNLGGGAYNATIGVYTDTGSAAEVTAALRSLTFVPAEHRVAPGETFGTGFTVTDTDSAGASTTDFATSLVVTTGTVVPTISGTIAGRRVSDQATVHPFADVTVADLNTGQTETVTVTLSAAGTGSLSDLSGGSYNAATGVYTVTGSAAAVTGALQILTFRPAGHQGAPNQTVTTGFSIFDTDSAGATASDARTSVVATGGGTDPSREVVLQGSASQYIIIDDGGSLYVQDTVSGRDGAQTLPGVDVMVFTDGVGVFDPTGSAEDVARLYRGVLGRLPDVAGLENWTSMVDSGTMSLAAVADSFAGSPEFIHNDGSMSGASVIGALYRNALGRPPDPSATPYWTGILGSGANLGAVAMAIAESPEAQANSLPTAGDSDNGEIYRLYQAALGRVPDPGGQSYWASAVAGGITMSQLAQDFAGSGEFQADDAGMDAGAFVAKIYQNALDRAPDAAGAQYWTNAVEGGASQASVLLAFADSNESRAVSASATHANWVFIAS